MSTKTKLIALSRSTRVRDLQESELTPLQVLGEQVHSSNPHTFMSHTLDDPADESSNLIQGM